VKGSGTQLPVSTGYSLCIGRASIPREPLGPAQAWQGSCQQARLFPPLTAITGHRGAADAVVAGRYQDELSLTNKLRILEAVQFCRMAKAGKRAPLREAQ
jgi:hypothetical protein